MSFWRTLSLLMPRARSSGALAARCTTVLRQREQLRADLEPGGVRHAHVDVEAHLALLDDEADHAAVAGELRPFADGEHGRRREAAARRDAASPRRSRTRGRAWTPASGLVPRRHGGRRAAAFRSAWRRGIARWRRRWGRRRRWRRRADRPGCWKDRRRPLDELQEVVDERRLDLRFAARCLRPAPVAGRGERRPAASAMLEVKRRLDTEAPAVLLDDVLHSCSRPGDAVRARRRGCTRVALRSIAPKIRRRAGARRS